MILSYLNKIKEEYVIEQESIKDKIDAFDIRLKENTEFIKLLEDSIDSTYESLSPRSLNQKNKQKIDEIIQEQKKINEQIEELDNQYFELENKLNEVDAIIQQEKNKIKQEQLNEEKLNSLPIEKAHNLLNKTELCYRLIDIDPIRCKLELSSVLKLINEVIDEMQ